MATINDFSFEPENSDCPECDFDDQCCDKSCLGRLVVAPCKSIQYATVNGDIPDYTPFCAPQSITDFSYNIQHNVLTKPYQNTRCTNRKIAGETMFTFSVTSDICQSDYATMLMYGTDVKRNCPIDFIWIPKGNNFNGDLPINEQQTMVIWGRALGGEIAHSFPDADCQQFTRTFEVDGYWWCTKAEAGLALQGQGTLENKGINKRVAQKKAA